MARIILFCIGLLGWVSIAWAAYPQDAVDKRHIIHLLMADRFADLNALFSGLQNGYEQGKVDELTVMYAFRAFADSDPALQGHLKKWEKQYPDSFAVHEAIGDYHQRFGWLARGSAMKVSRLQAAGMVYHFRIAVREYDQALTLKPKLIPAYAGLINIYTGVGQEKLQRQTMLSALLLVNPSSYLIHFRYLFALQPKWGGSFSAMAEYLKDKVRPFESQNPRLKSLEGFPHYVRADEDACGCGVKLDLAAAEKEIRAALKAGVNPMYLWEQGDIYRYEGEYRKAVDSYSKVLQERPQNANALTDRAICYYKLGDMAHALQDYNSALSLDPMVSRALRDRGFLYYKQKQMGKAERDLKASLVYGTKNMSVHQYLAYIYYDQKNFPKAEFYFSKAINLGDSYVQDRFYLAASQYKDHNCAFVKTTHEYLKLCRAKGSDCKPNNMRGVSGAAAYAVRKGICPQ